MGCLESFMQLPPRLDTCKTVTNVTFEPHGGKTFDSVTIVAKFPL